MKNFIKRKEKDPLGSSTQMKTYRYTLGNHLLTTLESNRTKQLHLIFSKFPVRRLSLIQFNVANFDGEVEVNERIGSGTQIIVARNIITFRNVKENGLGIPLPKGKIWLSRRTEDGFGIEELCESTMKHEDPENAINLSIGQLNGVFAKRKRTNFHIEKRSEKGPTMTETVEFTVYNDSSIHVNISLEDTIFRWKEFEVSVSNPPFQQRRMDWEKIRWNLQLRPKSKKKVLYTVVYSNFNIESYRRRIE